MRRLIVSLSTAAIIVAGAIAGLQAAATASTAMLHPDPGGGIQTTSTTSKDNPPDISFTTTMISYTATDVAPAGLSPGDGYGLAGRISRYGAADGLSTAQCNRDAVPDRLTNPPSPTAAGTHTTCQPPRVSFASEPPGGSS